MLFIFEVIGGFIAQAAVEGGLQAASAALGRRTFRGNVVPCELRASGGRVYTMRTEWSRGTATVTPGHISFAPAMGTFDTREALGTREIDVEVVATVRLGRSQTDTRFHKATIVELVTPRGNLEWSLDTSQLRRAGQLLLGASPDAQLGEPFGNS